MNDTFRGYGGLLATSSHNPDCMRQQPFDGKKRHSSYILLLLISANTVTLLEKSKRTVRPESGVLPRSV